MPDLPKKQSENEEYDLENITNFFALLLEIDRRNHPENYKSDYKQDSKKILDNK